MSKMFEPMLLCGKTLDMMLSYDGTNVYNSAAAEVLVRRMYGLVESARDVHKPQDWKNEKKLNRRALERYDIVTRDRQGRAPAAEREVKKELEHDAQIRKWFDKAGTEEK